MLILHCPLELANPKSINAKNYQLVPRNKMLNHRKIP